MKSRLSEARSRPDTIDVLTVSTGTSLIGTMTYDETMKTRQDPRFKRHQLWCERHKYTTRTCAIVPATTLTSYRTGAARTW